MRMPCSRNVTAAVHQVGEKLNDRSISLKDRFRALFTLKNTGGKDAIDYIAKGFDDPSALLKHELAYCLGQMQDVYAIPALMRAIAETGNLLNKCARQANKDLKNILVDWLYGWDHGKVSDKITVQTGQGLVETIPDADEDNSLQVERVLKDKSQEPMVRHEAGEALGAIGSSEVIDILKEYANDPVIEVAETCQLALHRVQWLQGNEKEETSSENPYASVDPAPPAKEEDTNKLQEILLDESLSLFERYRAMFSLRNQGTTESVKALTAGLKCKSALFRHEIAYVLGQIQHEDAVNSLAECLADADENPMVRHECAEALGSVAKGECLEILQKYLKDKERVVKESCEVALDMLEYETSSQFQYADGLSHTSNSSSSGIVDET